MEASVKQLKYKIIWKAEGWVDGKFDVRSETFHVVAPSLESALKELKDELPTDLKDGYVSEAQLVDDLPVFLVSKYEKDGSRKQPAKL